jgi:putative ABC transport system substrate-binding protein
MTKRIHLIIVSAVLLFAPLVAQAQQVGKVPRIGILMSGSPASHKHFVDWFRQGLRDLGYVEGKNFVAVNRWAMGKRKRLPWLVKELIKDKVDVIVINGSSSIKAALKVTRTVPIVVGFSSLLARSVTSLARPGGNITGSTYDAGTLGPKRLGLLREAVPGARRVTFLFVPSTKNVFENVKGMETAGKGLGIKVQPLGVRTLGEIESAFISMVKERADALIIRRSSVTNIYRKRLAALAITNKLPTMCDQEPFARAGCLMTYTPDHQHTMRRAAAFVDKILKGAKPAELPVEMATRYNLVVNLKTAKALGIRLPPSILLQANEVIE